MEVGNSQVHQGRGDSSEPSMEPSGEASKFSSPTNGGAEKKSPPSAGSGGSGKFRNETTDMALFVRTSSETLSDWNRQRIVEALQRETTIDPDTAKKGLQVEFSVEDEGVFTTPWSGRVTYRRLIGEWPEAFCAENPYFFGMDTAMPTAHAPDF